MNISVIISTYNRHHYLKKVIDGYFHQSRLPDEIVIADDGSKEETASLVKKIKENTKMKILHIWQEDIGFRAAQIRNKAVASSSGKLIIMCDDDVIPNPRLVEDHIYYAAEGHFIQGHRVLLGPVASEQFTVKDISLWKLLKLLFKGQADNVLNTFRFPIPFMRISKNVKGIRSCNMSFFKKDFLAVNGFNEDFEGWGKEDTELIVRFYKYGLKRKDIRFRACCYHLYHPYYSRENLDKNIALLSKTVKEDEYYCQHGIDKYI